MSLSRYYEDINIHDFRKSKAVALSVDEIVSFASQYDPQYFHADPKAARNSPFGEIIASGAHSIAHWTMLNHTISEDINWICGLGWDDVKFEKALRADIPVYATAECISKRLSKSDPQRGVIIFRYKLIEDSGDTIISFTSTNLIKTRNFQEATDDNV